MVEYSQANARLSDTQLKKLKIFVKNKTETTLRMSLKMFDENDVPHELLMTTRQRTKLRNAFNNSMSTDLKLSKLAGPLMKVAVPLAKNILAPLGIAATASAIDPGIKKKHGSGKAALIISSKEMNDIIKIIQTLEDSNILFKGVTETFKNETKEQKGEFLSILLGFLGASLLGNMLAGIEIIRAGSGSKKGKEIVRAGYGKECRF